MDKKTIIIFLMVLITGNAFAAVDRIIDPDIPIEEGFIDYEQNFDEILISVMAIGLISFGGLSGTLIILSLIYLIYVGAIKIPFMQK